MPKLWDATIATHRQAVRRAVIRTTLTLIRQRGLRGVTMSEIAEATGIGRATLYKYFPDVESVLAAWHADQVDQHLDLLEAASRGSDDPGERIEAVLATFAEIVWRSRRHRDSGFAAVLHEQGRVADAERRLHALVAHAIADAAADGRARDDIPPDELAWYAIRSLGAAARATSTDAVARLVSVTLHGLTPPTR